MYRRPASLWTRDKESMILYLSLFLNDYLMVMITPHMELKPSMCPSDKYKGAVVEDLQLPPAFSVASNESISRVIEMAYERDFSHVPYALILYPPSSLHSHILSVLNTNRRPLGYVDVANLKEKWESSQANPVSPLSLVPLIVFVICLPLNRTTK